MPRGKKRSVQDQVAEIDSKIQTHKAAIKELEAQKKSLLDADRNKKLQVLLDLAEQKGLSVDQMIDKLSQ